MPDKPGTTPDAIQQTARACASWNISSRRGMDVRTAGSSYRRRRYPGAVPSAGRCRRIQELGGTSWSGPFTCVLAAKLVCGLWPVTDPASV
jgi:hypothetical protein